ncbi:uroporphyrinogen decarboxylase family protein [Acetobacterium sp.]|uniref:uroporphyrinogen decarboxylase family protein n=1 Tax=Acetobacterium sp. TaxID=1872094 RepID=UPI0027160BA9|nr:uroporphyrinogen decarboxylase family protein [Acetobacterium sp.]MDO9491444.1 uroporphyrinogen decarboxylase family protein [Acetobacterium sp.]
MNSIERINATLNFEKPDRVPVFPQIFGLAGVMAGVPVDAYVRDGHLLAECQIKAIKKYGYDAVFSVMDTSVEAEAVGGILEYKKDMYPTMKTYAIQDKDMIDHLVLPDPNVAGRMPEMLKAVKRLRREVGDEHLVVGCVMGPLTIASQLMGMETALYLAIDEPGVFIKLLDFCTEIAIKFGLAQIQAGAHLPMIFDPAASPAVVPPQFFREIELPQLQKLCRIFDEAGSLANWLHIAGPTASILPFYPEIGVDIANFDYYVSPQQAVALLPDLCLDGNIKSISFIEDGPEEIAVKSAELLDLFENRGGFILSSGCEISPLSCPENIAAMVNAAKERG